MILPPRRIDRIVRGLAKGEVIAYPTEGVWGLGCLPDLEAAVTRILAIKQRSWTEGLILVASKISHVDKYLDGISSVNVEKIKNLKLNILKDNNNTNFNILNSDLENNKNS